MEGLCDYFSLCFTIPVITTTLGQECIQYLVLIPRWSQNQSCLIWSEQSCQDWEQNPFFLRGLWRLCWVPAPVLVWTLGLCVCCWSDSRRCQAADYMQDLKQPNRLVITANHGGGCIMKETYKRQSDSEKLLLLSTVNPQQASEHLNMFWQYLSFIAKERSVGGEKHWGVSSLGETGQSKLRYSCLCNENWRASPL